MKYHYTYIVVYNYINIMGVVMLSKINLFILGLISEKPNNPYRLKKILEKLEIKQWFPMSDSTVYKSINSLQKKGYVIGETKKENNNPEKTIYSITEDGKKELDKSLKEYLRGSKRVVFDFDVASSLVCHLNKEDAVGALQYQLDSINHNLEGLKANYNVLKDIQKIPYVGFMKIIHNINRLEALRKTINEFLDYIKNDKDWNHFPLIDFEDGRY